MPRPGRAEEAHTSLWLQTRRPRTLPTPARLSCRSRLVLEREQARQLLDSLAGSTDAQMSSRLGADGDDSTDALLKLALLYAVMEHCELPKVRIQPAAGLCAGMLVSPRCFDTP